MDRNYVVNIIKFALKMGIMGSLRKLRSACYTRVGTLNAEFAHSAEPVPFEEKDSLEYTPIRVGQVWSEVCYGSAWFRFTGKIPESACRFVDIRREKSAWRVARGLESLFRGGCAEACRYCLRGTLAFVPVPREA